MTYSDPIRTAERMAELSRRDGSKTFQAVTTVCLGLTAAVALAHALKPLLRELVRDVAHQEMERRGR